MVIARTLAVVSRSFFISLAIAVAIAGASCGDSSSSTPAPTPTPPSPTNQTFSGILAPAGTAFRTFTTTQAGAITASLTSSPVVLGIGIGIPEGFGCQLTTSLNVGGGTPAQVTATADPGDYCVSVYDVGNVTDQGAPFVVSIVHP